MSDLLKVLEKVVDRRTFLEFLNALAFDWEDEREKEQEKPSSPYGSGANGWENGTIGAFLDAAFRCAGGMTDELKQSPLIGSLGAEAELTEWREAGASEFENPWREAAEILYGGKIYE